MKCKDATIRDRTVLARKRPARCGPPSGRGFFRFELRAAPRRTRRQSAERKISAQTRLLAGAGRRPRAARMERRPLRKRSIPRQGVKVPSILLLSGQERHTTMIDAILKHRPLNAINFAIILLPTRKHVGNTPIFLRLD